MLLFLVTPYLVLAVEPCQRCEPFINEMNEWLLSFFSINFIDAFRCTDWGQGRRKYHFFYLKLTFWDGLLLLLHKKLYVYDVYKKWLKSDTLPFSSHPTPASTCVQDKEAHSSIFWMLHIHVMIPRLTCLKPEIFVSFAFWWTFL